jgi:hypothetical protein
MAKGEKLAAFTGAMKGLVGMIPGIGAITGGVDAYRAKQRENAGSEFLNELANRVAALEGRSDINWLNTPDGEMFFNKVFESAIDAQLADKRDLFVNALVSGARTDAPVYEKTKFVDLLRWLSRDALTVLHYLHEEYGPRVNKPGESCFLESEKVATELAPKLKWNPYRIQSAYRELSSIGLFSSTTGWSVRPDGVARPVGSYASGRGEAYTDFAEQFVEFIKSPGD